MLCGSFFFSVYDRWVENRKQKNIHYTYLYEWVEGMSAFVCMRIFCVVLIILFVVCLNMAEKWNVHHTHLKLTTIFIFFPVPSRAVAIPRIFKQLKEPFLDSSQWLSIQMKKNGIQARLPNNSIKYMHLYPRWVYRLSGRDHKRRHSQHLLVFSENFIKTINNIHLVFYLF